MWIERRLADDPDFPKPIYLGRLRYWRLADIEGWERARAAAGPKTKTKTQDAA
jgi:predicted DNA-binding transcriptional regulator AlpA